MTEPFELPEDHTALDDEQLAAALAGAVQAFDAKATSSLVTEKDIAELRSLASAVEAMRTEQNDRITAAKAAAAEIEQLAARVRGDDPNAAPAVEEPVVEEPAAEPESDPEPVVASAAMVRRPALNLASVRAVQPRVLPEPPAPGTHITAAVDISGYSPGAPPDPARWSSPTTTPPALLVLWADERAWLADRVRPTAVGRRPSLCRLR